MLVVSCAPKIRSRSRRGSSPGDTPSSSGRRDRRAPRVMSPARTQCAPRCGSTSPPHSPPAPKVTTACELEQSSVVSHACIPSRVSQREKFREKKMSKGRRFSLYRCSFNALMLFAVRNEITFDFETKSERCRHRQIYVDSTSF